MREHSRLLGRILLDMLALGLAVAFALLGWSLFGIFAR